MQILHIRYMCASEKNDGSVVLSRPWETLFESRPNAYTDIPNGTCPVNLDAPSGVQRPKMVTKCLGQAEYRDIVAGLLLHNRKTGSAGAY